MARVEIEGKQIGYFTVVCREVAKANSHRAMYLCRCKCGYEHSYERGKLIKGDVIGCPTCCDSISSEEKQKIKDSIIDMFAKEGEITSTKKREVTDVSLSDEQQLFVDKVISGYNVLVDACIGSGKTTAIQELCNVLPSDKKILYLTYNKLLKLDAKSRIKGKNITVTNYHGYAYQMLTSMGMSVGVSDLIQTFISVCPEIDKYDVLIIDEYQDIDLELSKLLWIVKNANPNMQIVAVGDMEQKIYDKTTLNVDEFIHDFLGIYEKMEFTKCFRLSSDLASKLGRIWKKEINGVNEDCKVEEMEQEDVVAFLSKCNPCDVLCLGARTGQMSKTLNVLERDFPQKYNKKTVYASIADNDSGASAPNKSSAIFTTYDSSKGLERPICVVFDYTEAYWIMRVKQPLQDYYILRNIFCVAASRGKTHIIFVKGSDCLLSEGTISTPTSTKKEIGLENISSMFDFKYKESVEKCFNRLNIEKIDCEDKRVINVKSTDELIDLSPCIGVYQEASYFNKYDIDKEIDLRFLFDPRKKHLYTQGIKEASLEKKILFLTSLETRQDRYLYQVEIPFIRDEQKDEIIDRLKTVLSPDEESQVKCTIPFVNEKGRTVFRSTGFADVVKDNIVYELKFVSELKHEHFLQCASYMIGLNLDKGILWNVRDNTMYSISIPDKEEFIREVAMTVTKDTFNDEIETSNEKIAVIDTETNWNDQVMSIGVVIADASTYEKVSDIYYIFNEESRVGGMFSDVLMKVKKGKIKKASRKEAMSEVIDFLNNNNVKKLFAYNASFDKSHLKELDGFSWYDIMRIAAYKQYNDKIPKDADCFKTGKLKRNYGVEPITRMLSGDDSYYEVHNALLDANDELNIMRLLGKDISTYDEAELRGKVNNAYKEGSYEKKNDNNKLTIDNKKLEPKKNQKVDKAKDDVKENSSSKKRNWKWLFGFFK